MLVGGPDQRTTTLVETIAGDTTVGHAIAYCRLVEALAGVRGPAAGLGPPRHRAGAGAAGQPHRRPGRLAGDVGFLPTASYCGALRGDFLNLTAVLCGSRFGRGLVRPGGVRLRPRRGADGGPPGEQVRRRDRRGARLVRLFLDSPSVAGRFEGPGAVPPELGNAPRAGRPGRPRLRRRARRPPRLPVGIYRFAHVPVSTWRRGRRLRPRLRALAGDPAQPRSSSWTSSARSPTAQSGSTSAPLPPDRHRGLARRGLARRDLPRRAHRRRGAVRPLQGRRPVVPQLDRAGDGAARPADLRLPALQQELQPLLLRARPVMRVHPAGTPPAQGHRTVAYPDGPARLPGSLPRPAGRSTPGALPGGCRACADACPTEAITARAPPGWPSTWAAASSAPTASRPARKARSPSPATTGWRRATREDLVVRGDERRCWRARSTTKMRSPLRPLAEAAAGARPAAATAARPT